MKHLLNTLFISLGLLLCSTSLHAQFFIEGDGINYMWTSFSELEKASGNPYAQLLLGNCYYEGDEVERDYEKAAYWYRKAAENDIPKAQYNLGVCYHLGLGVEQDYEKAIDWYHKAAQNGDVKAQYTLGRLFQDGAIYTGEENIIEKDYEQAAYWLQKVAELDKDGEYGQLVIFAEGDLLNLYLETKEYEKALHWYRIIDDSDDVGVGDMLFNIFKESYGSVYFGEPSRMDVEEDSEDENELLDEDGLQLLMEAVDNGSLQAPLELAHRYEKGIGVPKDINKMINIYTMAGENGNSDAVRDLARLYAKGEIVDKDLDKALYWYKKSFETGQHWVQANFWVVNNSVEVPNYSADDLADDLADEEILARFAIEICDENDMVAILEKANSMGSLEALLALSRIYAMGKIVKRDEKKALNYYKQFLAKKNESYENITIADVYYDMYYNAEGMPVARYGFENVYEIVDEATGECVELEEYSSRHWLLMAAQLGHIQAQTELGDNYAHEADFENALLWWHKAAANNDSVAQYRIAKCYEQGFGVEQNNKAALEWCTKAAEHGNDKAQNTLGEWYLNGDVAKKDPSKAFNWFKQAAENGNYKAQYSLGLCYFDGIGVKQNYGEAAKCFYVRNKFFQVISRRGNDIIKDKATYDDYNDLVRNFNNLLISEATDGDVNAQFSLGIHYLRNGNVSEALLWLERAANTNEDNLYCAEDYQSQYGASMQLVKYYTKEKDYDKAIYWFKKHTNKGLHEGREKDYLIYQVANCTYPDDGYLDIYQDAVDLGSAEAAATLACVYAIGNGVERDDDKAVELYRKYLELSNKTKQNVNIGDVYYYIYCNSDDDYSNSIIGYLYESDRYQWIEKAIEAGSDEAQNMMGNSYYFGCMEIEQDYNQAVEWYQKAAEHGNKEAQYQLASCYEEGLGVSQDYNMAFNLYKASADNGYTWAQFKTSEFLSEGLGIKKDEKLANEYYRKAAEGFKTMREADEAFRAKKGFYFEEDLDFPSVYESQNEAPVDESAEKDVAPIIDNN